MKLRKSEWKWVAIIWVVGAMLLATATMVFSLQSSQAQVSEPNPPNAEGAALAAAAGDTALKLYSSAESTARFWQDDVQLVSVSTTWSNTAINLIDKPATWLYRFYSPSRQRLYFVAINADGNIKATEQRQDASETPAALAIDDWKVDSGAAMKTWLDSGGSAFLGKNPGIDIVAQLKPADGAWPVSWTVAGFSGKDDDYFTVMIDARNNKALKTLHP
jgi:hypothetical protein